MAEGQKSQAFGTRPDSTAEFKTESGLGVKVFVRPGSMFCRDFEAWLKDNDIHDFEHSLTNYDGQIAAILTYRKNPKTGTEEVLKDTIGLIVDLVDRISELAQAIAKIRQDVDLVSGVRIDPPTA